MNKQDLRYAYLNYFRNQYAHNAPIESKTLIEMAPNGKIASEVLEELKKEELITGINFIKGSENSLELDLEEVVSLTEKGVSEINKMNFAQRLLEDTEKNTRNITPQKTNTTRHFSARRLAEEKKNGNMQDRFGVSSAKQLSELNAQKNRSNIPYDLSESFTTEQIAEIYKNLGYGSNLREILKEFSKNREAFYSAQQTIQNSKNAIEAARGLKKSMADLAKNPSSVLHEKLTKKPEDKLETFTFEGILGQNCGEVEKYINSSKQLQAKDFIVSRGLRVLRGFAKASTLFEASRAEYDYQRPINEPHIDSIKDFLLKMKDSAKYLPEVTLVARNDYELEKFTLNLKSLSDTQKGIIDNLNYYKLKVQQNSLYRIDGNHRIEAANSIYIEYSKDLYLPFSIILWNPEDYYGDGSKVWKDIIDEERKENEAFLFYFLNSKAKKLEIEENLQGIIKASRIRWSDDDLKIANPNLSLMRLYQEQMQTQIYLNDELCKKDSLKQIAEILTQINENNSKSQIDLDKFKIILQRTNFILNTYKPIKLKEFSFYCKLVFYIVYMNEQDEECIKILENLDNWVIKYKFDNSTFTDPILLYNNATKSNYLKPINIFVAMPFDEENIENYTEWINLSITKLKEKNIKHSEQLNLNKIMPNRGYAINLIDKIMDEIQECDIFIADISPYIITIDGQEIKCVANPNVMYELGIAHNLKKPIILMREDNKFSKVPSDIQEKYRNTYKRSNTKKTQQTIQKAIECVLEDFFD